MLCDGSHHELWPDLACAPLGVPSGKIDDISSRRGRGRHLSATTTTTTSEQRNFAPFRHCPWKSRGPGSVQEAGGSEGRGCHLLLCSTQGPAEQQQQRPAHTAARLGLSACRPPSLLPAPDVVGRCGGFFFSQRQQETAGQKATKTECTVTATTNDRANWPLSIPRWTKGT